jgi:hypothetical protein
METARVHYYDCFPQAQKHQHYDHFNSVDPGTRPAIEHNKVDVLADPTIQISAAGTFLNNTTSRG